MSTLNLLNDHDEIKKRTDSKISECSTLWAISELADMLHDHFAGNMTTVEEDHLAATAIAIRELAKPLGKTAADELTLLNEQLDEQCSNLEKIKEAA